MGGCLGNLFFFFFVIPFVVNLLRRFFSAPSPHYARQEAPKKRYLRLLMPLLAKIAKADGRVSESEISRVEAIFSQLNLDAEERDYAKILFNRSKQTPLYFEMEAATFAQAGYDFEVRRLTLLSWSALPPAMERSLPKNTRCCCMPACSSACHAKSWRTSCNNTASARMNTRATAPKLQTLSRREANGNAISPSWDSPKKPPMRTSKKPIAKK